MRFCTLLPAGLLLLAASSALADEAPARTDTDSGGSAMELLGDVADGVGGILKILVGPPISSPSPALNLPDLSVPSPPPVVATPARPVLPPPSAPETRPPEITSPPEPRKVVAPSTVTAPPPAQVAKQRPVAKSALSSMPPPAEPACRTRAATATLEQAAKLPRCSP